MLVGHALGGAVLLQLGDDGVVNVIHLLLARILVHVKADAEGQHLLVVSLDSRLLELLPHLFGLAVGQVPVAQLQHVGHGVKFLFRVGKLLYPGQYVLVVLLEPHLAVLPPPLLEFLHPAHDGLHQGLVFLVPIHIAQLLSDHVAARGQTAFHRSLRKAHAFGNVADRKPLKVVQTDDGADLFRELFHAMEEQLSFGLVIVVARDILGGIVREILYLVEGDVVAVPLGQIDGAVLGDAAHPCSELGGILQGVQPLPGAEKSILHRVLGGVGVAGDGMGHQKGGLAVADDQLFKGGLVPHEGHDDQGLVGLLTVFDGWLHEVPFCACVFERSVSMTIERGGRFGQDGNFLKRGGLMALL